MSDVDEEAFPRVTRELLAVLEAAGERRTLTQGGVLSRAATRRRCAIAVRDGPDHMIRVLIIDDNAVISRA